jgi:hypothetical protein
MRQMGRFAFQAGFSHDIRPILGDDKGCVTASSLDHLGDQFFQPIIVIELA